MCRVYLRALRACILGSIVRRWMREISWGGDKRSERTLWRCSSGRRCAWFACVFELFEFLSVHGSDRREVLLKIQRWRELIRKIEQSPCTFGLVPLSTVFRSLSSTSFCLIFLTTSLSCASATYRRLVGEVVVGGAACVDFWGVEGSARPCRELGGGVPDGVVDPAAGGKCQ